MSSALWRSGLSTCCACKMLVTCSNSPEIAKIWDLLNFRGYTFRFFFCFFCTTATLSSVLIIILVPDLALYKFRCVTSFKYFQTFFWMAILLGAGCRGKYNLNRAWTWLALCLKLCLYHKNISFLCYQQFEFLFFAKFFFNNDSLISNILMLICLSQLLKKETQGTN